MDRYIIQVRPRRIPNSCGEASILRYVEEGLGGRIVVGLSRRLSKKGVAISTSFGYKEWLEVVVKDKLARQAMRMKIFKFNLLASQERLRESRCKLHTWTILNTWNDLSIVQSPTFDDLHELNSAIIKFQWPKEHLDKSRSSPSHATYPSIIMNILTPHASSTTPKPATQ